MNSKFKHLTLLSIIFIVCLLFFSIAYAGVTDVTGGSGVTVKTTVRNNYTDLDVKGTVDLTDGKSYIVDFSKEDNLSKGLQELSDLDKTKFYKIDENYDLVETENSNEAIIKVEGIKAENKAIFSSVYKQDIKSYTLKRTDTVYTGSKLTYTGTTYENNILIGNPNEIGNTNSSQGKVTINEIRDDYYTRYNFNLTFKYGNNKITPTEYKFLEGANQEYTIEKDKEATFRIDADYSKFNNKVYLDNNLLDEDNYSSKSGSTIITLKETYLKTLSIGKHTLKVAFSDGGTATTEFTIKEVQKNENGNKVEGNNSIENTNTTNKNNTNTSISNPKTGDNIILYTIIFVVAFIGIIALAVIRNLKKLVKSKK